MIEISYIKPDLVESKLDGRELGRVGGQVDERDAERIEHLRQLVPVLMVRVAVVHHDKVAHRESLIP